MSDKIYTSELDKPELNEETLAHYGVLGMKWGVRKNPDKAVQKASKKSDKYAKKIYKTNKKYIKEAKKVSRFLGRKKAQQKVVRLNAKKDYLTAKKDKWDKKTSDIIKKENLRRQTKVEKSMAKDISNGLKGSSDKTKKAMASYSDFYKKKYVKDLYKNDPIYKENPVIVRNNVEKYVKKKKKK